VTIHPGFSGTVTVFNDVPEKTVLLGRPFVRFWLGVPDLPSVCFLCSSAAICLHTGVQKLARILSVYMKIAGGRGSTLDPAGGAHDASPDHKVRPDGLRLWRSPPTICAQIMVT